MMGVRDLAARRELLAARCELDRLELALAWHDLRRSLGTGGDRAMAQRAHPWLGRAIALVVPLIGAVRARRMSRYISVALLVYRIATGLRNRG